MAEKSKTLIFHQFFEAIYEGGQLALAVTTSVKTGDIEPIKIAADGIEPIWLGPSFLAPSGRVRSSVIEKPRCKVFP
jgi:hypothetical protein